MQAYIFPTTPDKGRQGIFTKFNEEEKKGYGLFVNDEGCLSVEIGDGSQVVTVSSEKKLLRKVWYLVIATFDAQSRRLTLHQEPRVTSTNGGLGMAILNPIEETSAIIETTSSVLPASNDAPLLIAATTLNNRSGRHISGGHFNPAVTLTKYAQREINKSQMLYYIVAQCLAGLVALSTIRM